MDEELNLSEENENPSEAEENTNEKSISSDLIRGHINTIILRSLYDGDKYGYEIIAEIERKSHGQYSLKQPSLYSALKRLEKDGYVTSYWGGSVGGGRRKYFSLTEEGKAISERNQSEWEYSRTVIDSLISEKDFDFSQPAPTAVDMRVLKRTTSRVPTKGEEDEWDESVDRERPDGLRAQEVLDRARAELEEERAKSEEALREERIAIERERDRLREEYEEKQRLLEEEKRAVEEEKNKQNEEMNKLESDSRILDERIRIREEELERERLHYDELLAQRESQLEEERKAHALELEEQEKRVREEEARLYATREKQILHENYLRLVNAPPAPAAEETADYNYYTAPVAEEAPAPEPTPAPVQADPEREYRSIVHKLYSNSIRTEEVSTVKEKQSLGQVDFYDLETRAAQDGIKISTSAGRIREEEQQSETLFHKGKICFFSAIIVFLVCLVEGSIVLAVRGDSSIPLFYPYFIWGVGLSLLLVTGVAYANKYGERSIRKNSIMFLINAIVAYVLIVIFILVLALAIKIEFTDPGALATFVLIPCIFFLNIVIYAGAYTLLTKKLK